MNALRCNASLLAVLSLPLLSGACAHQQEPAESSGTTPAVVPATGASAEPPP